MFRRDRDEAGIGCRRRVHLHRVHGAQAELMVRRRLDDYIRTVWARRTGPDGRDARLAMIVLLKRSFSGMGPLRRSLLTRLESLGTAPAAPEVQMALAWDTGEDDEDAAPAAALRAPGLEDESEERSLLRALAEAAAFAEAQDSKRRALVRVLMRVREPAIVFTEYRDTLTAIQGALGTDTTVLHGGMDRLERAAAVSRFNSGGARVLLATDAAGEGLNLQQRCRLVVNLELPWNPMRLEQRIGRVDRIGQRRTVHAINLLASGTAESGLLLRLAKRIHEARNTVGAVDDVLGGGDEGLMAACLGLQGGPGGVATRYAPVSGEAVPRAVQRLELGTAAREVAARLALQRQLIRASGTSRRRHPARLAVRRTGGIFAAAVRRSRLPAALGRSGLLVVFRVRLESHAGLAPSEHLVPVFSEAPVSAAAPAPGRAHPRVERNGHARAPDGCVHSDAARGSRPGRHWFRSRRIAGRPLAHTRRGAARVVRPKGRARSRRRRSAGSRRRPRLRRRAETRTRAAAVRDVMIEGVCGTLVSHHYAEHLLGAAFAGRLGEPSRDRARRRIRAWWRRDGCALGPSSSLRSIYDRGAAPVLDVLGFSARRPREACRGVLLLGDATAPSITLPLLVGAWGAPLDAAWGAAARESARLGCTWVMCFNGRSLRLCDGRNTFARGHLEFDLEALADHPAAMALFWGALRAEALHVITPAIVDGSARHGVSVSASLRDGVRDALLLLLRGMLASRARRSAPGFDSARLDSTLDQAFIIVYRVLFLLFAESRSLVPIWHPVYRRSYTVEGLRTQAETPGSERGIWESLQAMSRLAHTGCHAGSLVVAPFNGRLFAPARAPLAETMRLDDRLVADALMALTTLTSAGRRERVSFGDLGVEQLGAVYESVLDYQPQWDGLRTSARRPDRAARTGGDSAGQAPGITFVSRGEIRKSSGTFYTPRAITEYLVRHTLQPLVEHATADGILRLRVLDPAMGSGALLVASCRYLATAYEAAVVRERGCFASDIGEADRADFRRLVAQHCLYGVDLNPMAVQVARLSMWLTTLARGRPLSFLDHRLVAGDSLAGATLEDVSRQPPGGSSSRRASGLLPLFESDDAAAAMRSVVPVRDQPGRGA